MSGNFTLTLVLTHACDLACTYCSAGPKDARRLDEETGRVAIDRACASLGESGVLDLGFFGGEPLLEWPLARRLLGYARSRATVRATLTTNGSRIDERVARELVSEDVEVSLSIDGLPEVHDAERRTRGGRGSYEAARAAFERLAALGRAPGIVSVVRPSNVGRLVEGVRFLIEGGARALEPSLDFHARWSRADVAALGHAVSGLGEVWARCFPEVSISWIDGKVALLSGLMHEKVTCGFGRGEVAVAPSGRLYPCERLVQDDRPGPLCLGNVREGTGAFARHSASCAPENATCGGCAARFACSNACACANLARTGAADRPDGLVCALEQASLRAARAALEKVALARAA